MTEPDSRLVPLSPTRAAIARRMTQSKQAAPHIYLTTQIELDAVLEHLADGRPVEGDSNSMDQRAHPTLTAALVRALALTLHDEPTLNAHWSADGPIVHDAVHLGVAIALDDGLIAPALLGADSLDLAGIADALGDLVTRARARKLRARELTDGTFTLSNLGMYPVSDFAAIINPPQVAILATGRAEPQPRVVDGAVVVRTVMHATLSADHRAVDGATGARFLGRLKERLEAPEDWITDGR